MDQSRWFIVLTLLIFSFSVISASCEEGQIDINSASAKDLELLDGIGPVKAQAIIDNRTFDSVDDLIKVKGIGDITLEKIKSQGLACVDDEGARDTTDKENNVNIDIDVNINSTVNNENSSDSDLYKNLSSSPKETELQTIELGSPKAIKSDLDSQISDRRNYALYGLLAFGIMLGLLFLIKNLIGGKRQKNEFE